MAAPPTTTRCRPSRLGGGLLRVAALAAAASGCSSDPPPAGSSSGNAGTPSAAAVAYVAGRPIRSDAFDASLREAAGRAVLEEMVLARLIEERLAERGVSLSPEDLEQERAGLLNALAADPDTAERLIVDLRERRGLGPTRFERLLRRNAGLRKLSAGSVEVTDAAVRRAFERSHGRRYLVRLLTADTPAAAAELRGRVLTGESFAEVAAEASTDASRTRGGLLDPLHPDDPTFPAAIRTAVTAMQPGALSGVVALESGFGYAVLRLEEVLPADGATFEAERATVRGAVRADLERQAMERLARTLRADAEVVVLDAALQAGG